MRFIPGKNRYESDWDLRVRLPAGQMHATRPVSDETLLSLLTMDSRVAYDELIRIVASIFAEPKPDLRDASVADIVRMIVSYVEHEIDSGLPRAGFSVRRRRLRAGAASESIGAY